MLLASYRTRRHIHSQNLVGDGIGPLLERSTETEVVDGAETVTVAVCVMAVPLVGVTVSVYLVVAVGLTETPTPLVAAIGPGVITPVPPLNTPVSIELPPGAMVVGTAVKLVIVGGAGFTVMVTIAVAAVPLAGVTVSVYCVVAVGLTETATPLVAARFPGVIMPVPPLKTPVNVALCPSVIVAALAVKLVMDAGGVVCMEVEPPPQPANPARPAPSVAAHAEN